MHQFDALIIGITVTTKNTNNPSTIKYIEAIDTILETPFFLKAKRMDVKYRIVRLLIVLGRKLF